MCETSCTLLCRDDGISPAKGKTVKCEVWAENKNGDQVIKNGESTITIE